MHHTYTLTYIQVTQRSTSVDRCDASMAGQKIMETMRSNMDQTQSASEMWGRYTEQIWVPEGVRRGRSKRQLSEWVAYDEHVPAELIEMITIIEKMWFHSY